VTLPPSVAARFGTAGRRSCLPGTEFLTEGRSLMTADACFSSLTARNATLADLAALLRNQQARKVDVVAPAPAIRAEDGWLVLDGTAPDLGEDGVTMTAGRYRPTDTCDQGIADKLGIPAGYLRRMREACPGLYDANVNGWLGRDDRSFLVRGLRGPVARPGSRGLGCRTATRSSTTSTCSWPRSTASGRRGTPSRSSRAT
jgi:hypothetical protein